MRGFVIILSVCLSATAFQFSDLLPDTTTWNDLKVKWDPNVLSSYAFAKLPLTKQDAINDKYVKISDIDDKYPWKGERYLKDNDYALILLFDVNGYIAGIQTSIPGDQANGFPKPSLRPPFNEDGNRWVMSAYFTDPSKINTVGRSAAEVAANATGTDLYLQNSTRPEDSIKIPHNQEDIAKLPRWTEGKCFETMGKHYWYNLSDDMDCADIFPVFLLYNRGKLNGMGWAMTTGIDSPRYEYPPRISFQLFMNPPPKCLQTVGVVTTMHIYFNKHPELDFC